MANKSKKQELIRIKNHLLKASLQQNPTPQCYAAFEAPIRELAVVEARKSLENGFRWSNSKYDKVGCTATKFIRRAYDLYCDRLKEATDVEIPLLPNRDGYNDGITHADNVDLDGKAINASNDTKPLEAEMNKQYSWKLAVTCSPKMADHVEEALAAFFNSIVPAVEDGYIEHLGSTEAPINGTPEEAVDSDDDRDCLFERIVLPDEDHINAGGSK